MASRRSGRSSTSAYARTPAGSQADQQEEEVGPHLQRPPIPARPPFDPAVFARLPADRHLTPVVLCIYNAARDCLALPQGPQALSMPSPAPAVQSPAPESPNVAGPSIPVLEPTTPPPGNAMLATVSTPVSPTQTREECSSRAGEDGCDSDGERHDATADCDETVDCGEEEPIGDGALAPPAQCHPDPARQRCHAKNVGR